MSRFGTRLRGNQPVTTWMRGGGIGVLLIQRGTITINNASATGTATITAVDPNASELIWLGDTHGSAEANNSRRRARIAFTNSTTITATREDTTGVQTVSFEVVTYQSGVIKSVQRGTVTTTATITQVETAKSKVSLLGWSTTQTDGDTGVRIDLTNSTTVTATVNNGAVAGYQVIEFY